MMDDEKYMSNLVIVNATALASSGALTILNQFLEHALNDSKHKYLCFIHESVKKRVLIMSPLLL